MTASATTVPIWTADEWAMRLLMLFPNSWTGDAAKQAGGVLYSLFSTLGSEYAFMQENLLFVLDATRIDTATNVALDAIAQTYFGVTPWLPAYVTRANGEGDDSFKSRIKAEVFAGGATRNNISAAVARFVGETPRIIEPFNLLDCATIDANTYIDIDTVANPGRISDSGLRAAFMIESLLPSFGGQGNNPVYGIDQGVGIDRSYIIDPLPSWFSGTQQMDQLMRKIKALGVRVYRRWGQFPLTTQPVGNSSFAAAAQPSIDVSLFPPMAGEFVVLARANWNTMVSYTILSNSEFTLNFSVPPPPAGGQVDWMTAPLTASGFGQLPIEAGATTADIAIPAALAGCVVQVLPTWNTDVRITSLTNSEAKFEFSVPPSELSFLAYGMFGSPRKGSMVISSGQSQATVLLPPGTVLPYQLIADASWNTGVVISKNDGFATVTFTELPAENETLYWGLMVPGAVNVPSTPAPPPPSFAFAAPARITYETNWDSPNSGTQILALSSDASTLYVGAYANSPSVYNNAAVLAIDTASGSIKASQSSYAAGCNPIILQLSPDGSKLYFIWTDATLHCNIDVLDPSTLNILSTHLFPSGTTPISDFAFSDDGTQMACWLFGGSILTLDLTSMTFASTWSTGGSGAGSLAFQAGANSVIFTTKSTSIDSIFKWNLTGTLLSTYATGVTDGRISLIRSHPISGQLFCCTYNTSNADNDYFIYDPATSTLVTQFATSLYSTPYDVVFDSTNTSAPFYGYFASSGGWPWIIKLDSSGAESERQFDQTSDNGFSGLALDHQHSVLYGTGQDTTAPDSAGLAIQSIATF